MSLSKWMAEKDLEEIEKTLNLLSTTKDRKKWRGMIATIMRTYVTSEQKITKGNNVLQVK